MISRSQISLNRILFPALTLEAFFKTSSELNIHKVELRNDLPGKGCIDAFRPMQIVALSQKYAINILTINAQQKFNLQAVSQTVWKELKELVGLASAIGCKAVILVPNNDVKDNRTADVCFKETVAALKRFAPLFEDSGIKGYVEPLGFRECSLRSKVVAMRAIQESGGRNYKIVYDTFHHRLGPDTGDTLLNEYDVSYTGLVHVSGVESAVSTGSYRDKHRILITAQDRINNREQLNQLVKQGYRGDISFEPFAEEVQTMELEALKAAVDQSINFVLQPVC
ncbi:MAG: TIM barrel protein [Thermodesulfobacteriota bacterium]